MEDVLKFRGNKISPRGTVRATSGIPFHLFAVENIFRMGIRRRIRRALVLFLSLSLSPLRRVQRSQRPRCGALDYARAFIVAMDFLRGGQ